MMDRNENTEIVADISLSDQLEALLTKKLNQLPTDEELKNKYGDASDLL